jgi:AraC family transcriptional regulator
LLSTISNKLDSELAFQDEGSNLAVEALLLEAAVEIARQRIRSVDQIAPGWLKRAKVLIHEEHSRNLSLAEIGAAAGVHPVHLARAFRRYFKCTVAEYVRRIRIGAACHELEATDAAIVQIAVDLGFADQSHFTKTFKRITGMTPGGYRQLVRIR